MTTNVYAYREDIIKQLEEVYERGGDTIEVTDFKDYMDFFEYVRLTRSAGFGICDADWLSYDREGHPTKIRINYSHKLYSQPRANELIEKIVNAMPKKFNQLQRIDHLMAITAMIPTSYEPTAKPVCGDESMDKSSAEAHVCARSVCSGSSEFFHLLLNKAGIENKIIVGDTDKGPHAWNIIKYDGKWYHADALHAKIWYVNSSIRKMDENLFLFGDDNPEMEKRTYDKTVYPKIERQSIKRNKNKFKWGVVRKGDPLYPYSQEMDKYFTHEERKLMKSVLY